MTQTNAVADTQFRWFYWFTRAILVVGLAIGWLFDLSQLEGKGWGARTVFYGFAMVVLLLAWRLSGRRFTWSYLADGFLVAPFAVDIWGNIFGLYDSVEAFDDILHLLNWTMLTAFFTISVDRSSTVSKLNLVSLGTGFGAVMIVLWEAMEWLVAEYGSEALHLTYDDTVGDLCLSTLGGFISSLVTVMIFARRRTSL